MISTVLKPSPMKFSRSLPDNSVLLSCNVYYSKFVINENLISEGVKFVDV